MEIFGEKINILVPFKRSSIINEISSKIKTTFCSVYKYFKKSKNYKKCVFSEACHDYNRHKEYLSKSAFFF